MTDICPSCGSDRNYHNCRCLIVPKPDPNWVEGANKESEESFNMTVQIVFSDLQERAYNDSHAKGFWPHWTHSDPEATGYVYGAKVGLIHTEVSEMMEALRSEKQLRSEKIPAFSLLEEEAADAIIRILDLTGSRGLKIGAAIMAKLAYNKTRPPKHGKRF